MKRSSVSLTFSYGLIYPPWENFFWVQDVLLDALFEQVDDVINHGRNFPCEVKETPKIVERF